MQCHRVSIVVPTPFSLKASALSHGWHECSPMSWCEGGRCFQIIERHGDRACRVSVVEGRRGTRSVTLTVTIEGEALDEEVAAAFVANLRRALHLDRDISDFYALCRDHPTLHVLPRIGAGRGLRSACMAENVIKGICGTNVTWSQAVKMINRIAQLGPIVPNFRSLHAWPTPREILRAGEKYLLEVCRVGYRAGSILTFCDDVCAGRFDPAALDELAADHEVSSDTLLAHLKAIRGIGPSTAHGLLSFLGRHDRLAIDSSTVTHVARVHMNGRRPTLKQIEKIYAPYGSWRNQVWWYEHWLTWGTARQILAEEGLPSPSELKTKATRPDVTSPRRGRPR